MYGDDTVDIRLNSPDITEKNLSYFILKAPTQQFLQESYETSQWKIPYSIKQKFHSIFTNDTTREIMAFIIINGSRHFHGYLMIENDLEEYQSLTEEEAKQKVLSLSFSIKFDSLSV